TFCAGLDEPKSTTPEDPGTHPAEGDDMQLRSLPDYVRWDLPTNGLNLEGGERKSVRVTFEVGGGNCSCCSGPLTGMDPTKVDCGKTPGNCVTFMLCGNLNDDQERITAEGRRALCDAHRNKEHIVSKECLWERKNFCLTKAGYQA